ncbi:hypothetical protein DFH11DRAFT_1689897 [Phellopilus nigrolimitatus]|nr:hypothetical protein DFH11DRAFT_1689897 [Phellopilus nigrolimitatus]
MCGKFSFHLAVAPILGVNIVTSSHENGETSVAIKDPSHPSLFYHLFGGELGSVFALSFLEARPASARSRTVLGLLPAHGLEAGEEGESGLNDFMENRKFSALLHEIVKDGLLNDEIWRNNAIQIQSGWMHVFDQRNPPPLGRIPDPDDILASVRVEDSRILVDTYQPMPSYRLCTGDGVCQLTDGLMGRLKSVLQRVADEEKENN